MKGAVSPRGERPLSVAGFFATGVGSGSKLARYTNGGPMSPPFIYWKFPDKTVPKRLVEVLGNPPANAGSSHLGNENPRELHNPRSSL
jgi:hypothetical protein